MRDTQRAYERGREDDSYGGCQDTKMTEDDIVEEFVENTDGVELEDENDKEDNNRDYSRLDTTFHLDHVDSQVYEDLVDSGIDVEHRVTQQFGRGVAQYLYAMRDELKHEGPPQQ